MKRDKEPRIKINATIRESYVQKLEKIRSNYKTKKGKYFTFSGVLSLILSYGFSTFEKRNKVVIDDIKEDKIRIEGDE